jgi:N5-(cytidine 5'-diphosphoramidyl)-L-glutamine hydrolase
MRIAITQRIVHNLDYEDDRDALSHDWVPFLESTMSGCVVVPVPNGLENCETWMESINPGAVVLSNGNDLGSEAMRDHCESQVFSWALGREIPVLGVCRGLQFINQYFGGSLDNCLAQSSGQEHVGCEHEVTVSHTAFSNILKSIPVVKSVNSYHQQGVQAKELAPDLIAFAMAADGTVEGLLHSQKPVLAVQWHPERHGTDESLAGSLVQKFFTEGRFW